MAADVKQLEKEARALASKTTGVLAILLSLQEGKIQRVKFNRAKAEFIVNGKPMSAKAIINELRKLESYLAKVMEDYATKLINKDWTLDEWHLNMEKLMQSSHVLFGALAIGGIAIAARETAIVPKRTARDEKYLKRFKGDVAKGKLSTQAQVRNRAKKYLRSSWVTFGMLSHRLHIALGYREGKRITTAMESCSRTNGQDGCLDVRGIWYPIRDVPVIGSLVCGQWCRCYIIYR